VAILTCSFVSKRLSALIFFGDFFESSQKSYWGLGQSPINMINKRYIIPANATRNILQNTPCAVYSRCSLNQGVALACPDLSRG
jgi:hypothetical protein